MATAFAPGRLAEASRSARSMILGLAPYWMSAALAVASGVAAALTLLAPDVLRGTPVMNGSARGTALVALVVALPILSVSMLLVSRGAVRPLVAWLGAAAFLQYKSVVFLLATPFNSLFLIYVAMFALGFWTLVLLLRALDVASFASRFAPELPVRALAVYLAVIAVLNAGAWLAGVVPALLTRSPAFLEGTGLTTNPIYVQDLSFWIPLMFVSAALLWRRHPWGFVLVGGMLVYFFIESISIALDQWMGSAADPASAVASAAFAPIFAIVAGIGLIPLYMYFRNLNRAV
jgi:hypothetical protein